MHQRCYQSHILWKWVLFAYLWKWVSALPSSSGQAKGWFSIFPRVPRGRWRCQKVILQTHPLKNFRWCWLGICADTGARSSVSTNRNLSALIEFIWNKFSLQFRSLSMLKSLALDPRYTKGMGSFHNCSESIQVTQWASPPLCWLGGGKVWRQKHIIVLAAQRLWLLSFACSNKLNVRDFIV
jgi:hypothetical protein